VRSPKRWPPARVTAFAGTAHHDLGPTVRARTGSAATTVAPGKLTRRELSVGQQAPTAPTPRCAHPAKAPTPTPGTLLVCGEPLRGARTESPALAPPAQDPLRPRPRGPDRRRRPDTHPRPRHVTHEVGMRSPPGPAPLFHVPDPARAIRAFAGGRKYPHPPPPDHGVRRHSHQGQPARPSTHRH
jgi:hypothetical protein